LPKVQFKTNEIVCQSDDSRTERQRSHLYLGCVCALLFFLLQVVLKLVRYTEMSSCKCSFDSWKLIPDITGVTKNQIMIQLNATYII